jgi:DNA primase
VFDSDLAGRRAADRSIELFLGEDVRIYVASVTGGKDPCDLCHDQGADAFRACLASAKDALAYKWDVVREQFGAATSPAAQRRALDEMLGSLAKVDTLVSRDPSVRRDLLLAHISHTLGLSEQALRADLARIRRTATRSAVGADPKVDMPAMAARGRRWAAERELLTALVCRPSRLDEAIGAAPPDRVEDEALRRLYEALLANTARRDGDIESIVLALDDQDLASLAVELFERGEAIQASRHETDTGPGPLGHMMDEALAALHEMDKEEESAARSRAASEGRPEDTQALRDFAEARKERQGFLPPAVRRRPAPEG